MGLDAKEKARCLALFVGYDGMRTWAEYPHGRRRTEAEKKQWGINYAAALEGGWD